MTKVYAVVYRDSLEEDNVITLFDNDVAAKKCFEAFKEKHKVCWLDAANVFSSFPLSENA